MDILQNPEIAIDKNHSFGFMNQNGEKKAIKPTLFGFVD
jgi:hypothetical protein